jgi:S-adenosyl methyltransferase
MQQEGGAQRSESSLAAAGIDTNTPQSARVYDFLLGGKDNFAADRAVGATLIDLVPTLPVQVKANRAFLARSVRYLVGEAGIRQFLDIGTGIPTANNVHEVAQQIAPETRVLYVDYMRGR